MPNIHDARDTYANSTAFLVTRDEIPMLLNARGLFGCGAEIGVKEGHFSAQILDAWHGSHLISIDPWVTDAAEQYVDIANVPQPQHDLFYEATLDRLRHFGDRSSVWRMTSLEASPRIPRHSLDFIYIDARHDYESVLEDLEAWFDKVRPGGIIAGHDYIDGHFPAGVFGVKSAVDEFFASRGLRVCPTLDDQPWISWIAEAPLPASLFAGAELSQPESDRSRPADVMTGPRLEASAPATVPAPAADRIIGLNLSIGEARHELKLKLDGNQMSQRLMIDSLDQQQMYEPETSMFFIGALQPGDTFIDIGTHVGYFSMLAASMVGRDGKVISFEPEPENFRRLGDNVSLNAFKHVETVNAAVGETSGRGELFFNIDNDGGHALWDVGNHPFNARSRETPQRREIEITCLDDYLRDRDIPSLKLIKIDAEGCEFHILRGAKESLLRFRVPFIIAEVNNFGLEQMGTNELDLRAWMEEIGYETYVFVPGEASMMRLRLDQRVESHYVYNLLFRHPEAPALRNAA